MIFNRHRRHARPRLGLLICLFALVLQALTWASMPMPLPGSGATEEWLLVCTAEGMQRLSLAVFKARAGQDQDQNQDCRPGQGASQDSSHSRLSPKVALKYQPWEFLGVYVSYGEAFRAPTMTEIFGNLNTRRALFNFRPNPGLKPETSKTKEVGATLAFDDLLAVGDSLRAKVTYFREDIDDLIDQQVVGRYVQQAPFAGTGMIFQRVNVAQAERHGGEAQLSYQWQRLSLGAGYSRLRSRNADTGAQLYAPPDKFVLGSQYRLDDHWSLNYQGQYVWAQDYDATELWRRKGCVIHDIGAAFEYRQYRADLGVSNLFDKAYSTYQQSLANTFTYEEGRSVNLTLSARF